MQVHPEWAPLGAARFKELVDTDFFKGVRFFRVIGGFMAQFGIHGNPKISATWKDNKLTDDPVRLPTHMCGVRCAVCVVSDGGALLPRGFGPGVTRATGRCCGRVHGRVLWPATTTTTTMQRLSHNTMQRNDLSSSNLAGRGIEQGVLRLLRHER